MLAYLRFSLAEVPAESSEGNEQRPRRRWLYYALALALYVAALLSKTVAASVPAVLLVVYWWSAIA